MRKILPIKKWINQNLFFIFVVNLIKRFIMETIYLGSKTLKLSNWELKTDYYYVRKKDKHILYEKSSNGGRNKWVLDTDSGEKHLFFTDKSERIIIKNHKTELVSFNDRYDLFKWVYDRYKSGCK